MSLSCQMPRFSHLLAYLLQATIKGRFINTSASESCLGVKTTAFLASDSHHMARKKKKVIPYFLLFPQCFLYWEVPQTHLSLRCSYLWDKTWQLPDSMQRYENANTRIIIIMMMMMNKICCWKTHGNQGAIPKLGETSFISNVLWPGQALLRQYEIIHLIWTIKMQ